MRPSGAHTVLEHDIPQDIDPQGQPIPMTNNAERNRFNREVREYNELDNIAFADLMKACRVNPRTKSLCETGQYNTSFALMNRLKQRYHTLDDMTKASHLLRYHSLKQNDDESGAAFVDREQREYLSLRSMGVNVDDSLRLTKFIQQGTTNDKHKSLAQTIYTTPNMTLSRATSLFESYQPPEVPVLPTVNALICSFCKRKGHRSKKCWKKRNNDREQRKKKNDRPPAPDPTQGETNTKTVLWLKSGTLLRSANFTVYIKHIVCGLCL